MAEYRFTGETTEITLTVEVTVTVPDENRVEDEVPEWAKRIVDAWLHGRLLDFKGCTVPKGIAEIIYKHFWNKHKLGVCTTCIDPEGREVNREENHGCDVSCAGTGCLHQRGGGERVAEPPVSS